MALFTFQAADMAGRAQFTKLNLNELGQLTGFNGSISRHENDDEPKATPNLDFTLRHKR